MPRPFIVDRRGVLLGSGAVAMGGLWPRKAALALQLNAPGPLVSVDDFGARSDSEQDNTPAIQAAIHAMERIGGGTVLIRGRYKCGNLVISGSGVWLQGQAGWLVDGRLTIGPEATNARISDLGLVNTTGDRRTYLLDVSGRNCSFNNVQLVKDPPAGGYQMYLRQPARGCSFSGLKLRGSNGIMVAGSNHTFDNFDLESTMTKKFGGDDAFAIKAIDAISDNIMIRNGSVRGFGAMVSFGSEVGTSKTGSSPGIVRNVTVQDVTADRCTRIAFFKPGAFDYDYRNGVIEHIVLKNLTLDDPAGDYFRNGIYMIAGRAAVIRDIKATGIKIRARARDRGVAPTSAIDIALMDKGPPATIEDVSLEVTFADPYSGSPHGPAAPGYPLGHIVQIEKRNPASGSMAGIVLNVEGRGAAIGGIHIGAGLDGAVTVRRAVLTRIATDPASTRGAGIWSDSRLSLGDVSVESVKLPKYGGRAFPKGRR